MTAREPQPKSKRKPAPKKVGAAGKKRVRVSRMGYYIIIFGWLTIAVNFLLAFEWVSPDVVMDRVMSAELSAFAFRGMALIIPLIFSILGYMVYQREKLLWRAIATGRKLEHMNVSLQTNYEKLAGQMSEKDKTGLTDQAIDAIKGIHRQTKWSINMIASLMGAQSKKVSDEKGADALMEFQRRFRAVEHIHEALSKGGDDCTTISAPDYLRMLANEIVSANTSTNVRVSLESGPWPMGIDRALYCGLIVSELVSNSMRFAFTEDAEKPEIKITLSKGAEGIAMLRVSDNGVGMPEDLDVDLLDTLGLKIIGKLARQLKGTVETNAVGGTSVDIKFPLK